jgi:hypothetical protein
MVELPTRVHYFLLKELRNPELWAQENKRARNLQYRLELRRNLAKMLTRKKLLKEAPDDQVIFVTEKDGQMELVDGWPVDTKTMQLSGKNYLQIDNREQILLERHDKDQTQFFRQKDNNWVQFKPRKAVIHQVK